MLSALVFYDAATVLETVEMVPKAAGDGFWGGHNVGTCWNILGLNCIQSIYIPVGGHLKLLH